jgi:hypothetical protein
MALTKRLTLATLIALAISLFSSTMAQATTLPIWKRSECAASGSTWTGFAGINNDNPTPATVTALSVTNGVQLTGMAVGSTLGSFAAGNLEGSASGIPGSVASFTVTITLSWKDAAGATATGTRDIVVPRPANCTGAVATTAPTTAPSTTAAPTPTTAVPSPTTAVPGATTVPGAPTPTVLPGPVVTPAPPATRVPVPLQPTVLASTVTTAPSGVTTLPVTGSQSSGRVLVVGAIMTLLGVVLITTSYIGRPPTSRTSTRK